MNENGKIGKSQGWIFIGSVFFISIALWLFSFYDFISGKLLLYGDATSYYEHVKFYIDNIGRGIYPLWETTRCQGINTDFFMQRIGSFNPIYFFIIVFKQIGIPYINAYLIFLMFYYLFGLFGFFILADEYLKDKRFSIFAFLLLLFSSLSCKLFDSYIIFTFVPLIWFFVFFVKFFRRSEAIYLIGSVFCFMVLLNTYIPFYFLLIFFVFLLCFVTFYFKKFKKYLLSIVSFCKYKKVLSVICILAILISAIPGILLYSEFDGGELIMPGRHDQATHANELVIDRQRVDEGGIQPVIVGTGMFSNLNYIKLDRFYIPVFFFIPLLLGAVTLIKKRQLFLICYGGIIYLISIANVTPIAPWLYKHIFIFKLFRNYEHFLSLALLPIVILLSADLFRSFLQFSPKSEKEVCWINFFVLIVHVCLIVFLSYQENTLISTYAVVILSLIFHVLYFSTSIRHNTKFLLISLLVLVSVQPLEVYCHLRNNSVKSSGKFKDPYRYKGTTPFLQLKLSKKEDIERMFIGFKDGGVEDKLINDFNPPVVYMTVALKWYYVLRNQIDELAFYYYSSQRLILYDHVEFIDLDEKTIDFKRISSYLGRFINVAFVSVPLIDKGNADIVEQLSDLKVSNKKGLRSYLNDRAEIVTKDNGQIKVLSFDGNSLKLKTNFKKKKFLVYNDCFHSGWNAYIDQKQQPILRANLAFKGLLIPSGEHIVYFRFSRQWRYILNYFTLFIYLAFFVAVVCLHILGVLKKKK